MKKKPSLGLMVIMLMFPQIVETIYSPALSAISQTFAVSNAQAAQTLSIYFSAFAVGVAVWGVLADRWGRRPAMLAGLLIYACAAWVATQTDHFMVLMIARAFSAFGIAVGSIVTQTMLRDVFDGEALAKVFSVMGLGIAISPIIGMFSGGQLMQAGGHQAVFFTLFAMAIGLLFYNYVHLPETQSEKSPLNLRSLSIQMLKDGHIWQSACLIALYNVALFAYYQLGGFHFAALGFTPAQFGYSGLVLGLGSLLGSSCNPYLLSKGIAQHHLLKGASLLCVTGATGVYLLLNSVAFLAPLVLIVMAFGIAIPNVLGMALRDYSAYAGSAGALFGLLYYLLIGCGLSLAGSLQHLGVVLIVCSLGILFVTAARQV
ncbi:MFS transporter [Photobacterium sp. 1_MG-2023]|uniref:MFS transporter n=1 Tax=Photobacterium sp. 1_MG-2023 TaxID=3062646 RepID=UPI0026E2BFB9|nr:MFS transporter [Photobacterium sp. 1_MG-2023]MDO6705102.1 MFS transporter [Photobacterium sp. 1_MG-2023]